jgi:L-2-hydroxycarboxylate dehydrogenase (NAD+)
VTVTASISDLKDVVQNALCAKGVAKNIAADVAEVLLAAEAKGFGSHGLIRLGRILTGIDAGTHAPDAIPTFTQNGPVAVHADGHFQLGPHVAINLTKRLIETAKTNGIGIGTARNMTHFGIGGYYTEMMAREELVGIVLCNTEPAASPFGGKGKVLGTNPISFSCKASTGEVITVDMATTATARGSLVAAELAGKPLADYVAVDQDGVMTNDPATGLAGALLPLGGPFGYKGTGLAFMVDVLCGALGGAQTGTRVKGTITTTDPCSSGFFFLAIDPERFGGKQYFEDQVKILGNEMRKSGQNVLLPGERECGREALAGKEGITLSSALSAQLEKWCHDCGINYPF